MHHGIAKIYGKERKQELVEKGLVSCSFCKYHRRENYGRRAKEDKYKNIDKKVIIRWKEKRQGEDGDILK